MRDQVCLIGTSILILFLTIGCSSVDHQDNELNLNTCGEEHIGAKYFVPDGNFTISSSNGSNEAVTIDLGLITSINRINIPHDIKAEHQKSFNVDVATFGGNLTRILTNVTSEGLESFCFPAIDARYIRITSEEQSIEWINGKESIEVWGNPVSGITWIYDSQATLANDITMQRNRPHPQDPVLFSSGASGVRSHSIVDGWLHIDSGTTGNGRVYWDYHQLPAFDSLPNAGYNMAMTGTFKFTPEIDNLSIKDGNHGTSGWDLDGTLAFGGFGMAIYRHQVSSKAEYWHNYQGSGSSSVYPHGLRLEDNVEHKYLITLRTRPQSEEVVLNIWLAFADHGWVRVMQNRTWRIDGWNPGNVPERADKEDILRGPSHIRRHHIWTRANNTDDMRGTLPIKDVKIGVMTPIP